MLMLRNTSNVPINANALKSNDSAFLCAGDRCIQLYPAMELMDKIKSNFFVVCEVQPCVFGGNTYYVEANSQLN